MYTNKIKIEASCDVGAQLLEGDLHLAKRLSRVLQLFNKTAKLIYLSGAWCTKVQCSKAANLSVLRGYAWAILYELPVLSTTQLSVMICSPGNVCKPLTPIIKGSLKVAFLPFWSHLKCSNWKRLVLRRLFNQ